MKTEKMAAAPQLTADDGTLAALKARLALVNVALAEIDAEQRKRVRVWMQLEEEFRAEREGRLSGAERRSLEGDVFAGRVGCDESDARQPAFVSPRRGLQLIWRASPATHHRDGAA